MPGLGAVLGKRARSKYGCGYQKNAPNCHTQLPRGPKFNSAGSHAAGREPKPYTRFRMRSNGLARGAKPNGNRDPNLTAKQSDEARHGTVRKEAPFRTVHWAQSCALRSSSQTWVQRRGGPAQRGCKATGPRSKCGLCFEGSRSKSGPNPRGTCPKAIQMCGEPVQRRPIAAPCKGGPKVRGPGPKVVQIHEAWSKGGLELRGPGARAAQRNGVPVQGAGGRSKGDPTRRGPGPKAVQSNGAPVPRRGAMSQRQSKAQGAKSKGCSKPQGQSKGGPKPRGPCPKAVPCSRAPVQRLSKATGPQSKGGGAASPKAWQDRGLDINDGFVPHLQCVVF